MDITNIGEVFKTELLEENTTSRNVIDSMFIVVQWPEVQTLMEEEWFQEESILINDEKGLDKYGSSAYFVPVYRLI